MYENFWYFLYFCDLDIKLNKILNIFLVVYANSKNLIELYNTVNGKRSLRKIF